MIHPQRKSPRLQGYDYAQSGAYFVTICTHGRLHLFGDVQDDAIVLSPLGMIALEEFAQIPTYWLTVDIDLYVVMPNHVHAIIVLAEKPFLSSGSGVGTPLLASEKNIAMQTPDTQKRVPTLGVVVGNYKAGVTRLARQRGLVGDDGVVWQGRYHDHIIRDERDLDTIRQYVLSNPARWHEDTFYTG